MKVVRSREAGRGRTYERELSAVQRFEPLSREHDGFADILQTGQGPGGRWFYYVMELADDVRTGGPWSGSEGAAGEYQPRTLSRVLRGRGRLPARECVEMGLALARAMRFLHGAGLLHRDIKPSNIVFANGRAKLADIGLVVEQSRARSFVGTQGYIPPEGPNTPQADIYALGMVLYEAGMGMAPEQFPRPCPGMREDPEAATLRELNAVVLRACATDLGRRYPDAALLEEELAWIAAGRSVRRRRRRQGVAKAAGVMAATAGMVLMAWRGGSLPPRLDGVGGRSEPGAAATGTRSQAFRPRVEQGARLLRQDDPAGAMVWFAEAMSSMGDDPAHEHVHRVRMGATLGRIPRLQATIHGGAGVRSVAMRPDGKQLALADGQGGISVWGLESGAHRDWQHSGVGHAVRLAYSADGRRLMAAPFATQPAVRGPDHAVGKAMVLEVGSGKGSVLPLAEFAWGVFSPDGLWLAAVRPCNEVWLHEVDGGGPGRLLGRHGGPISALAFSPDNSLLASCSNDRTARVWRVGDGEAACPDLPIGHHGMGLAFSQDSRVLASASASSLSRMEPGSSMLRTWSMPSGVALTPATPIAGTILSVQFKPGRGKPSLMGRLSGKLFVRDESGGMTEAETGPDAAAVRCWCVGPAGRWVVTGGEDGSVCVWNLEDGRPLASIPMHARTVEWMGFSAGGSRFFSASVEGLVRVWDVEPHASEPTPIALRGEAVPDGGARMEYPAAMDAAGRHLMLVRVIDGRATAMALNLAEGVEEPLAPGAAELPCDRWIVGHREAVWASWGRSRHRQRQAADAVVWRRDDRTWSHLRLPHPIAPVHVRFTADDQQVVTWAWDGILRRWDARSGKLKEETPMPMSLDGGTALSHDGSLMAVAVASEPVLRILRNGHADAGPLNLPLPAPGSACRWIPDSTIVAADFPGRGTMHWDASSGRTLSSLSLAEQFSMTDWDPGARRMLAMDVFGTSDVLAMDASASYRLMDDSANSLSAVLAFSACKRFIVSASKDHRLHVRDAVSGQHVIPSIPLRGPCRWAGLTRSGMLLAMDDTPRLQRWTLDPVKGSASELLELAHLVSGRRVNSMGQLEWIEPAELAGLARQKPDNRSTSNRWLTEQGSARP